MKRAKISIDSLIEIVSRGGTVKTGVDIYNKKGLLLLDKDVLIKKITPLLLVKNSGIFQIPVLSEKNGGVWDCDGKPFPLEQDKELPDRKVISHKDEIESQLKKIQELKVEATETRRKAQESYKKIITDIQETGGEFDCDVVEETVNEVFDFVARNDNAFSYLAKEIISYDDYLYNHSINVCAIATAVLKRFNDNFSDAINDFLRSKQEAFVNAEQGVLSSFVEYQSDDLKNLALGYFLHDVGKVLIPTEILNKKGRLTDDEFEIIKTHSFEKGVEILERNRLSSIFALNIARYHHSALFIEENRCYPADKLPIEIPLYVKICKLADIYDAMTSKRCYKDAMNPTGVVTTIYKQYADRDNMLQFMLHSFVKVVGIYPPGSIVSLANGQLAYVIDSEGPIAVPFTDKRGNTIKKKQDPINLGQFFDGADFAVDRRKPLKTPIELYDQLPSYLQQYTK